MARIILNFVTSSNFMSVQLNSDSRLGPSRRLLDAARNANRAVAALNFYNAETLRAHIGAANAANASIILQTTESTINYLGVGMAVGMARAAAEEVNQPIALHLDHGGSYELAARCIDAGYTSIMIDGSRLPFEENCALTRRVVELAHTRRFSRRRVGTRRTQRRCR